MISDKILFSLTGVVNHYDKIFRNRDIKDLIIPHIFMQILDALHRLWCRQLNSNPSDEISRNKGIISKDNVKYYILRFIYESMMSIDDDTRESIQDKIIEKFRNLKKNDPTPEIFVDVARAAYDIFMLSFDMDKSETWSPEILKKIQDDKHQDHAYEMPSPYDIMCMLKQDGKKILPHLLQIRKHAIKQVDDQIRVKLLEIDSN